MTQEIIITTGPGTTETGHGMAGTAGIVMVLDPVIGQAELIRLIQVVHPSQVLVLQAAQDRRALRNLGLSRPLGQDKINT